MKCYDCGEEIIGGPYWQARVSEDANTTRPTRQLCGDCFQKTMIVSDEQKGEEMKCEGCGKEITGNDCAIPRGLKTEDGFARWHISCYNKYADAARSYDVVIEDDVGTISNITEGCGESKCFTCGKGITGEGHHYNRGLTLIDQPPVYVCDECFGVFSSKLTCDGCRKEITMYSVWDDADGHRHRLCSSCYKAKRRIYNALIGQKGFTMNLFEYAVVRVAKDEIEKIVIKTTLVTAKDLAHVRVMAGMDIGERKLPDPHELVVIVRPFG